MTYALAATPMVANVAEWRRYCAAGDHGSSPSSCAPCSEPWAACGAISRCSYESHCRWNKTDAPSVERQVPGS